MKIKISGIQLKRVNRCYQMLAALGKRPGGAVDVIAAAIESYEKGLEHLQGVQTSGGDTEQSFVENKAFLDQNINIV